MKSASRFLNHIVATEYSLGRFPPQDTNQLKEKSPIRQRQDFLLMGQVIAKCPFLLMPATLQQVAGG